MKQTYIPVAQEISAYNIEENRIVSASRCGLKNKPSVQLCIQYYTL
jgi:hypothetical protein